MNQRVYEDFSAFLASSMNLELAASEQLRDLAAAMNNSQNDELEKIFEELARQSERHGAYVERLNANRSINSAPALGIDLADSFGLTEDLDIADIDLSKHSVAVLNETEQAEPVSARCALEAALTIGHEAAGFYQDIMDHSVDENILRFASHFARAEQNHIATVKHQISKLKNCSP